VKGAAYDTLCPLREKLFISLLLLIFPFTFGLTNEFLCGGKDLTDIHRTAPPFFVPLDRDLSNKSKDHHASDGSVF
jgi:hypothetical protein